MSNSAQKAEMKLASQKSMDKYMDDQLMRISDVYPMFHRAIPADTGDYTRTVLENNNATIARWRDEVASVLAPNGTLPAGKIQTSINIFLEGIENRKYMANRDRLPLIPTELVQRWVDTFRSASIQELYDMGAAMIKIGYDTIYGYIRDHNAQTKYEGIFSKSDDPLDWDRLSEDHPECMYPKVLPLGLSEEILNDILAKIGPITRNPIEPKKM